MPSRSEPFAVTVIFASKWRTGDPAYLKNIARIFSRNSRRRTSPIRAKAGATGLGLPFTRAIVEQHGGDLRFSTEEGKGTTFYFELPELVNKRAPDVDATTEENRGRVLICEDDKDFPKNIE